MTEQRQPRDPAQGAEVKVTPATVPEVALPSEVVLPPKTFPIDPETLKTFDR